MLWIIGGMVALYIWYCTCFLLFQRYFIFRPKRLKNDFTFSTEQPFLELNIPSGDGENLHALLLNPDAKKGLVIYFHGNWRNLDNYLPYTKKFTDYNYSVLISDYRSYGKSTGKLTEEHFFSDTMLWYEQALHYFSPEKIFIYGRSLGTAAAAHLAAYRPCRHVILETPFCNMYDIARRHLLLLPDGNYLKFGLRSDAILAHVKARVIILHGTKDETVSIHSARKLKPHLKPGDHFIEIAGGKHKNLHLFDAYHQAMDSIFKAGTNE